MVLRIMNIERYFFALSVRNQAQNIELGSESRRVEIGICKAEMPVSCYLRFDINSILGMFG